MFGCFRRLGLHVCSGPAGCSYRRQVGSLLGWWRLSGHVELPMHPTCPPSTENDPAQSRMAALRAANRHFGGPSRAPEADIVRRQRFGRGAFNPPSTWASLRLLTHAKSGGTSTTKPNFLM